MPELVALWGLVPAPLQPFLLPALICVWIFWTTRDKKAASELAADRWENENVQSLRTDNDRQSRRIAEMEDRLAELRRSYEAIIDKMRRSHEADTRRMTHDINRGWDLARDWCGVAHELRHKLANVMLAVPEKYHFEMPPPLPGIDRRPGLPAEQFPARYAGDDKPQ